MGTHDLEKNLIFLVPSQFFTRGRRFFHKHNSYSYLQAYLKDYMVYLSIAYVG
jgi:hypothetical protein